MNTCLSYKAVGPSPFPPSFFFSVRGLTKNLTDVPNPLGQLKFREHKTKGLENLPQAFVDLLHGKNEGKAVVVVAED